eukprot:m.25612 g.25612  ORF g.25612 m.25612 type:complete len:62 (+) comp6217_c0_seq1:1321-1506(+)
MWTLLSSFSLSLSPTYLFREQCCSKTAQRQSRLEVKQHLFLSMQMTNFVLFMRRDTSVQNE